MNHYYQVNPHAVNSLEQSNPELNQEESDGLTGLYAIPMLIKPIA